ncbi:hypothetical protein IFU40_04445 [Microbacterium sp. CFBP 13617]|uniref:hypothetical protein n=1 Tax=Microbacterium sp. CFBP 13617 TaxID=2774035 RepID=UPI00177D58CE|nr:hypothetical protein [Microbacterium sp. CFBP 13617]MBD8217882.1 hypothetical protein [Microbacterium sp. CFBP 13617]
MSTTRTQVLDAVPVEAFRGTFALADPVRAEGATLPPGWEGVFFPFAVALDDLRPDGTPARDGILPEIDLPRRMYAGEDTVFPGVLRVGDVATQTATAGSLVEKTGASGRLVFADIERAIAVGGEVVVRSTWHDVFLGAASGPARPPRTDPAAAAEAAWIDEVTLDARQLFRFSALTFNTHLVHYDRRWARDEEGLDDMLVHGPLLRILLVDAARRHAPARRLTALRVRMTAPAFVDSAIRLCGTADASRVVALGPGEVVLATAEVTWA